MTYKHLSKEQRSIIEFMINNDFSFTKIAQAISKDRTTISKEIKRNRYLKSDYHYPFDSFEISKAVDNCNHLKLKPYVCNSCPSKSKCHKSKLYYNSNIAQENYVTSLSISRSGIDISPETIREIENSIVPLIKFQKQSINQVYINHSDILYFSKTTFYKYINLSVFSLTNLDLPKKVKYKPRKHHRSHDHKRKLALLNGRSYKEFLDFISSHPRMNICQMDTVVGKRNSKKVLLTLIIKKTNFMLIRLLERKDVASVNYQFDLLKQSLGIILFSKVFRIVLTDNGPEFFDPLHIEYDYDSGKKRTNVFYCDPYSSYQKGSIEKNHEFIRKVFHKGTSFDDVEEHIIQRLEDTINNIPRDSLDGKTPYELTKQLFPDFIDKLHCSFINPDDVNLSIDNFIK